MRKLVGWMKAGMAVGLVLVLSGCGQQAEDFVRLVRTGSGVQAPVVAPGVCTGAALTNAPYAAGTGTALDPYIICTATQMNAIGLTTSDWNKNFKLEADISLAAYTGTQYNIIGNAVTKFTGVFDGGSHTISDLSSTNSGVTRLGLFGATNGATLRDLTLSNVAIAVNSGGIRVGAFVGDVDGGTLSNLTMSGFVRPHSSIPSGQYAGGIAGYMNNVTATNLRVSYSSAITYSQYFGGVAGYISSSALTSVTVTLTTPASSWLSYAGGVAGIVTDTTITRASATLSLQASPSVYVGGLVAGLSGTSNIIESYTTGSVLGYAAGGTGGLVGALNTDAGHGILNSYSTATVEGSTFPTGGLIGAVVGSAGMIVTNCYATGAVIAGTPMGGLVGSDNTAGVRLGVYTASFWNNQVNSTLSAFGSVPATPAAVVGTNTVALQTPATFSGAGWTSPTWDLTASGTFLKLGWQP